MVNPIFQPLTAAEVPVAIALAEKIWKPYYRQFFDERTLSLLFSGMYELESLKNWIQQSQNHYFLIQDSATNAPIGYCAYSISNDRLWLDKIYVSASFRRAKLGTQLLEKITRDALQQDCKGIDLRVYRKNKSAVFFYLKHGFEIVRAVDFAGPEGVIYPDYLMAKSLIYRS